MGSVISYEKCPYCGAEEQYAVDYYYRSGEMYSFCKCCGSHHEISLKRDENGQYVFNEPKHYDFGKIALKATIGDETIAVTSINSKEDFDIYNKCIGSPKEFEERFPEFCEKITNYVLEKPETFADAIEDYRRGCYRDRSGDRYSVALWHLALRCVVYDDKPFLFTNTKIDFDDTGLLVSECEYVNEEAICFGTFTVEDNGTAVYPFETEPTEEELQALIDDETVTHINVVKNGENTIVK